MTDTKPSDLRTLTADVVSAYVSANTMPIEQLPDLIELVLKALAGANAAADAPVKSAPQPAVPIKKSITSEYLISLEDGQKFKSLKRHLRAQHNMSPDEYRAKWGLPADYPMVAPGYASRRSDLAKSMGLGKMKQS